MSEDRKRESNLELFRVIVMLLIIAHHYVVNSGLMSIEGPIATDVLSKRSAFLLVLGAFGKTGINCFVLITGYFMCKSNISMFKFLKLYSEIVFYRVVIRFIFLFYGYEEFSIGWLLKMLLPFDKIESNFTGCYLAFYLVIPFWNILIRNMTERQHSFLVVFLLTIYTGLSSLTVLIGSSVSMNYFTWFGIIYLIASYIRLYPKKIFDNTYFWGWMLVVSLGLSLLSILIGRKVDMWFAYYFLVDSNKILAVLLSISAFLFFKNIKMNYSPCINALGGATFGVLLIHANSDSMRTWLWNDVLKTVEAYSLGVWLVLHAITSVIVIFIICSILDMIRIKYIEKPFWRWVTRYYEGWKTNFKNGEKTG